MKNLEAKKIWWPKREDWPLFEPTLYQGKLYRTGLDEAISLLILEEYVILLNASDVCGLFVNCSDAFFYASADAEAIPPVGFRKDEIVWKLYDMIKDHGYLGAIKWVSIQRKMLPLKEYRGKLVEAGLWCEELQLLAEGE